MWKRIAVILSVVLCLFLVGTVVALTVLVELEFDGVVVKAPQDARIYTAPSGGSEITGPVHLGEMPRGVETTVSWFLVNEGVESITPTVRVEGSNINCPSCDFVVYGDISGTPTINTDEWTIVEFNIYPKPDTPENTPLNCIFFIESE